ncbi:MAG: stage II sporulation protein M [Chloroflexota bacterium]
MLVNDFIKFREKDWQRLQLLIDKRRGRSPLTADEVRELGTLYRAVTSDLALARRDYPGQRVTQFLNQLLTRTHSYIYQQDVSDLRSVVRYFTQTLPRTFRKTWVFTLVAFLLFIIPGIVSCRLTYVTPEAGDLFGLAAQREILAEKKIWTDIPVNQRPYTSAFIMTNNIRIAILVFGGGISFGLFGVYLLVVNGLLIGGAFGLAAHYGMGESLLQFVFGHGVIELSVIFIAGGAGLQLGWALLNPGPYSRIDALGLAARQAVVLVVAAVPLLIIAGTIEGFFSPSTETPLVAHIAVGVLSGVLLYTYLILAGRQADSENDLSAESNQG